VFEVYRIDPRKGEGKALIKPLYYEEEIKA